MDVNMDRNFAKKLLKDRDIESKVLMPEAKKVASRLEAVTPRRSGKRDGPTGYSSHPGSTAESTTVEGGHTNAKRDRVAVWVIQGGAAAALNWRTRRDYMLRALR